MCVFSLLVIFVGSVVAASIPEIKVSEQFPTNVGSVFRWINMYPQLLLIQLPSICIMFNDMWGH